MLKKFFNKKSLEIQFWDWFMNNEGKLFYGTDCENERERIFEELRKRIKAIDLNLTFAFSPIKKDETKEFIVSADGMKESFHHVERLIGTAPEHPNWTFFAFRQPNPGDNLLLKIGELEIGYSDIFYRYLEEGDELCIELNIRNYDGSGFQQNAVCILLDSLLGEYDTVKEIDYIDWEILDETRIEDFYPFVELRSLIAYRKKKKTENCS